MQTSKIEVCLLNGKEKFNFIFSHLKNKVNEYKEKLTETELILEDVRKCVHSEAQNNINMTNVFGIGPSLIGGGNISKNSHSNDINTFINRIIKYNNDISNEIVNTIKFQDKSKKKHDKIKKGASKSKKLDKKESIKEEQNKVKTNVNEVINKYISIVEDKLLHSERVKFIISTNKPEKTATVINKIKDFILTKISEVLVPNKLLAQKDEKFNQKCRSLQWVDLVKHLGVKPEMLNEYQLSIAKGQLVKMDKLRFCNDILKMFNKSIEAVVKMIKFTTGQTETTLDDYAPFICYLLIKSKPKRMISNFGNCQYFIDEKLMNQNEGYILSNMEMIINFINNFDHTHCGMEDNEEEFNRLCAESLKENE